SGADPQQLDLAGRETVGDEVAVETLKGAGGEGAWSASHTPPNLMECLQLIEDGERLASGRGGDDLERTFRLIPAYPAAQLVSRVPAKCVLQAAPRPPRRVEIDRVDRLAVAQPPANTGLLDRRQPLRAHPRQMELVDAGIVQQSRQASALDIRA